MYLKSITINNFRLFADKSIFNLDFNENNNLNVIFGKNGCGKSTMIDAIYWCLYEKEISNYSNQPLCNYDMVDEAEVDDKIQVSVSCEFINNKDTINITREKVFVKINEFNEIKSLHPSNFQFSHFCEDNVIISHKYELIQKYFPISLFPFLLFDNEYVSLNNFDIMEIFYEFNGQNVLETSIAHLNNLSHDYVKKLKALDIHSKMYSELLFKEQDILNKHHEIKKNISNCYMKMDKLQDEHFNIKLKLTQYPKFVEGTDARNIFEKIDQLSEKKKYLTEKMIKVSKRKEKLVVNLYPILVALSTVESRFNNEELDNLLLKNTNFENTRFFEGYFNINNLFSRFKEIDYLKKQIEDIKILKQEIYDISEELENLQHILGDIDHPNFKQLISRRDEINHDIEILNNDLARLKHVEESSNKDLNSIRKDISRYKEEGDMFSPTNREYQFCLNATEFGKLIKQKLSENTLSEFLKIINDYFICEFNFEDKFKKVDVDDSFNISIIRKSNQKILMDDLSTNEKKLFIIALIFSIHECLQFEYPIILMDPFVNLDNEKKNQLISFILKKQKLNQILLILNENQYENVKVNFLNDFNEYSLSNINGIIKGDQL